MAKSKIEWTDASWNPATGCTKVSPGCKNCYAETNANRFWGERKFTDVRLHPERLEQPLHWREPRKVFVNSMSDLFHEDVPFEFIDDVFAIMGLTHWHTYQILTKRIERALKYFESKPMERIFDRMKKYPTARPRQASKIEKQYGAVKMEWPLPNVWLGTSCENQETADKRIPLLLQIPAAVRFVSLEPLLSHIEIKKHLMGLDWVIVGGESGPGARPCNLSWIRDIIKQCKMTGVAVFYKQGGSSNHCRHNLKGGCLDCMPEDLRIREFPKAK